MRKKECLVCSNKDIWPKEVKGDWKLCPKHFEEALKDKDNEFISQLDTFYNPSKNHSAIVLIQDWDGNWSGKAFKNGKIIESREVGPETALLKLLIQG